MKKIWHGAGLGWSLYAIDSIDGTVGSDHSYVSFFPGAISTGNPEPRRRSANHKGLILDEIYYE